MKKPYISPAAESIALQSENVIATSLRMNESEAEIWNKKKAEGPWNSSLWGTQETEK